MGEVIRDAKQHIAQAHGSNNTSYRRVRDIGKQVPHSVKKVIKRVDKGLLSMAGTERNLDSAFKLIENMEASRAKKELVASEHVSDESGMKSLADRERSPKL